MAAAGATGRSRWRRSGRWDCESAPIAPGIVLLAHPGEIAAARERAREMFTQRLRAGGLMVIPEALERWWPRVVRIVATATCEHCNQGVARMLMPGTEDEQWVHEATGKKACEPWTLAKPREGTIEEEH